MNKWVGWLFDLMLGMAAVSVIGLILFCWWIGAQQLYAMWVLRGAS